MSLGDCGMCDNGRKARRTSSDHDEAYLPENERPRRSMHSLIPFQQQRVQNSNAVARSSTPQLMQTNTHALEQLQSTCSRQQQQLDSVQAAVASLQKDAGRKRKHIQDLRGEVSRKQQRIMSLEQCLQKYQNICSYMVSQSQVQNMCLSAVKRACHVWHHLIS